MSLNKIIFWLWLFVSTIVTGFLVAEYRFFKEQAVQLGGLKEDYALYIAELKTLIENTKEQTDSEEVDTKKKTSKLESRDSNFLIVNRDPHYLKKSALTFARKHKVEDELQQLYDKQPVV